MADTDITELTELDATKVSGVRGPANGTPFLLLKAAAPDDVSDTDADDDDDDSDDGADDDDDAKKGEPEDMEAELTKGESEEMEALVTKGCEADCGKCSKCRKARKSAARATKMSPGVPAAALATPKETGHDASTGDSGKRVLAMAGKLKDPVENAADRQGGESMYEIEDQATVDEATAPAKPSSVMAPDLTKQTAFAVSSLMEAIGRISEMRAKAKEGDGVIAIKEADKNISFDAAIDTVARLVFQDNAIKVGRKISRKTQAALETARDHLNGVLGQVTDIDPQASHGAGAAKSDDKEVLHMASVTKEELAETVAAAAVAAVKEQTKKAAKKAKASKQATKKAKAKKAKAKKEKGISGVHANITAEEEKGGVRGEADARDVNAVKETDKIESLEKALADTQKQLQKLSKMARRGGPVLDGQFRGADPASADRMGENVAKSAADTQIEKLEKELEKEMDKSGPEAAQRASDLSYQLTLARLRQQHEAQFGTTNPLKTPVSA